MIGGLYEKGLLNASTERIRMKKGVYLRFKKFLKKFVKDTGLDVRIEEVATPRKRQYIDDNGDIQCVKKGHYLFRVLGSSEALDQLVEAHDGVVSKLNKNKAKSMVGEARRNAATIALVGIPLIAFIIQEGSIFDAHPWLREFFPISAPLESVDQEDMERIRKQSAEDMRAINIIVEQNKALDEEADVESNVALWAEQLKAEEQARKIAESELPKEKPPVQREEELLVAKK